MSICLGSNGELFVVDLERVCFFQADDHYSLVYYETGAHFMIPFGLSELQSHVSERIGVETNLLRLGRKYIINTKKVIYVNLLHKEVHLAATNGKPFVLQVSKEAIKDLMAKVKGGFTN